MGEVSFYPKDKRYREFAGFERVFVVLLVELEVTSSVLLLAGRTIQDINNYPI